MYTIYVDNVTYDDWHHHTSVYMVVEHTPCGSICIPDGSRNALLDFFS